MDLKAKNNRPLTLFLAFIISIIMGIVFLVLSSCAPFGNNSLSVSDGNIQYLDFFAYLKSILSGNNSLSYTMSNQLGFGSIGLFSYYLASPLNLLVCLFPHEQIISFFNLLVVLKISLCALTMALFLINRFPKLNLPSHLILSLSYAFMQYNIQQSSNIMWLDGVYMLPVMMLGVYLLISKNYRILLPLSIAFSIIFNWYTAGINCIFIAIYFLLEMLLTSANSRKFMHLSLNFMLSAVTGLLISSVLFFPTILALRDGRGSTFDSDSLYFDFYGNILNTLGNTFIGRYSIVGKACLFSGSLVTILVISLFINKAVKIKEKIILGVFSIFFILIFHFQPLVFLFSLFKTANSYYYRYAYISVAFFIFVAAISLINIRKYALIISALISSLLIISGNIMGNKNIIIQVVMTIAFIGIYTLIFVIREKRISNSALQYVLLTLVIIELVTSSVISSRYFRMDSNAQFIDYVNQKELIIDSINESDIRINHLSARAGEFGYNESLAYGYNSVQGYSSCIDNNQLELLDHLGYLETGFCTNIVETSVIPTDSLLAVKYIISNQAVDGLIPTSYAFSDYTVYQNPYALPMAFIYVPGDMDEYGDNPFENINATYKYLTSQDTDVFIQAAYEAAGDTNEREYSITIPDGNYALYGYLPWNENAHETITFADDSSIHYSDWGSQSVFNIPVSADGNEATFTISSEDGLSIENEYFYLCDLDALMEISDFINGNEVELQLEDNTISCQLTSYGNNRLFLSIPYINGMAVTINGTQTEPDLIDDCLISIPLFEGGNIIEITYSIPGLNTGIVLSLAGILLLAGTELYRKQILKKSK